jgi:hypothetical protein
MDDGSAEPNASRKEEEEKGEEKEVNSMLN